MKQKTVRDVYTDSFKIVSNRYKAELFKVGIDVGFSVKHITERAKQRQIAMEAVFDAVNGVYRNNLCQLVYGMCVGKHSTIEVRTKEAIVVFSRMFTPGSPSWVCSTVLDPNRHSKGHVEAPPEGVFILRI